jgi:hypothetical protein
MKVVWMLSDQSGSWKSGHQAAILDFRLSVHVAQYSAPRKTKAHEPIKTNCRETDNVGETTKYDKVDNDPRGIATLHMGEFVDCMSTFRCFVAGHVRS